MKRFFESIAIVAALVFAVSSCDNKALAPAEPSTPVLQAPGIDINILEVADNSFSFKITPQGKSSYYSYMVSNVEPAKAKIDSSKLYSVSYKGIKQGTVNYGSQTSWYDEVTGLDPNTTYYVYAVASSVEGNVGSVAVKSVKTSDTVAPSLVEFDFDENQVMLVFSENVSYVESKPVTAMVYAALYLTGAPVIATPVPAKVEVQDNMALLTFPDIVTPGSYYTVSYPEGAFVDVVGQGVPELSSRFYKDSAGDTNVEGVYGALENAPLEVVLPTGDSIDDLSAWIEVGVPSMVAKIDSKAAFMTSITHIDKEYTSVTEYTMKPAVNYGGSLYSIMVRPSGNPQPKDYISITIPAGACMDIYGNVNDEIVLGPYQYAYTPVYPKEGEYIVNNGRYPFNIKLTAVDATDPEKGYILQANWFDMMQSGYANPTLYLTVDEPNHQLICNDQFISGGQIKDGCFGSAFYYADAAQTQFLVFFGGGNSGKEPIVISYGDDGLLTTMSYCDYSVFTTSGNYVDVYDYIMPDVTISPAAATQALSSVGGRPFKCDGKAVSVQGFKAVR